MHSLTSNSNLIILIPINQRLQHVPKYGLGQSDGYAPGTPSSENVHVQLKLGLRMEGPCTVDHDQ